MISTIVSRLVILVFGTLYPAYASYKAVRTKNVKEYVKWMMYWIVFALFTCAETFTDVFLSWFPFYYEIKIILVLWLLSPATKGSSILYRKFVHPMLSRREQEIDDYIAKAKEQGYHTVLNLGTKGVNYATTVIMQTAIKGGGGIVNQLRKSYSLSDLTDDTDARAESRGLQERMDESGDVIDARLMRRRHSPRRSASGSSRVDMYFPEVDIRPGPSLGHVRSTEDVSSGYSSAEPLYVGQPPKLEAREGLVRTASVGGTSRPRTRTTRTSLSTKKTTLPEDSECSEDSESETTIIQYIPKMHAKKPLRTVVIHEESDSSDADFVDTIGFPVEIHPVIFKEQVSTTLAETDAKLETQPLKIEEEISTVKVIENVDTQFKLETEVEHLKEELSPATLLVMDDVETECKVEIKIEKELSIDVFEDTIEMEETDTKIEEGSSEISKDRQAEDDFNKTETIPEAKQSSVKNQTESDLVTKLSEQQKVVDQTNYDKIDIDNQSIDCETTSLCSLAQRGGRYNKHTAPVPPSQAEKTELKPDISSEEIVSKLTNSQESDTIKTQEQSSKKSENKLIEKSLENVQKPEIEAKKSDSDIHKAERVETSTLKTDTAAQNIESQSHPIKATLVLKPGVIKSVAPATEEASRTVFVSHSPKPKRKSSSQSKSKHESPISRLISLPKKIFGHKEATHSSTEYLATEDDRKEKRKSWHADTRSLTPVSDSLLSKSDTEGSCEQLTIVKDDRKASSATAVDAKYEENKLILRTLSHSPKQYRRKPKEEQHHYEESD